jgi:hypothetical protein
MEGWDSIREKKFHKMKAMGIVRENQRLPEVKSYTREKHGVMGRSLETDVLPFPECRNLDTDKQ